MTRNATTGYYMTKIIMTVLGVLALAMATAEYCSADGLDPKLICFLQTRAVVDDLKEKHANVQVMTDPNWTEQYYSALDGTEGLLPYETVEGSDVVILYSKTEKDGSVRRHGMFVNSNKVSCPYHDQILKF